MTHSTQVIYNVGFLGLFVYSLIGIHIYVEL